MALGDPTEHKKGRLGLAVGEQLENLLGAGFDARRITRPPVALDALGKGGDLEILLHIDAQGIDDSATLSQGRIGAEVRSRSPRLVPGGAVQNGLRWATVRLGRHRRAYTS